MPADVTLDELPPLIDSLHIDDGSYRDVIERDAVTPILPEFPTGSILKAYAFYGCSQPCSDLSSIWNYIYWHLCL